MGVYIKGMEMPMDGMLCIDIFPDGRVAGHYDCTIDWAKAIPVQPHGRLIDADTLESVLKWHHSLFIGAEDKVEKAQSDALICAISEVVNAPTIIPASEEGE